MVAMRQKQNDGKFFQTTKRGEIQELKEPLLSHLTEGDVSGELPSMELTYPTHLGKRKFIYSKVPWLGIRHQNKNVSPC